VLVVTSDADGLAAEVGSTVTGLKAGDNRFDLPAGLVRVVVRNKAGAILHDAEITVPAGGETRLAVVSLGKLEIDAGPDAKVIVDGKAVRGKGGRFATSVEPGARSVVVTRPGHVGRKGPVAVESGKTSTVHADLTAHEVAGDTTLAWVGIVGGGALVLGAVAIDSFSSYDDLGGDATRWGILGIGTLGFVGGTILLKSQLEKAGNPPTENGSFRVQVGQTRGGARIQVGLRF